MRIGTNPLKDHGRDGRRFWHRVVTPVYVPEDTGFFEHGTEVLEAALTSLVRTTGPETGITIVVNAASDRCRSVIEKARRECDRMDIIWKAQNAGKVEALFSAVRGYHEPFTTMTDSDVFFLPGWLEKTVEVFDAFPWAGMVSALPVPHLRRHYTTATWLGALARGMLRWGKLALREDMEQYMEDLGSPRLIPEWMLEAQWGVENRGVVALIGATHMQCTMRREVIEAAPREECTAALGLESEVRWMDEPADKLGFWKLSLPRAYVRHLGNQCPSGVSAWLTARANDEINLPPKRRRGMETAVPHFLRSLAGKAVRRLCDSWASRRVGW